MSKKDDSYKSSTDSDESIKDFFDNSTEFVVEKILDRRLYKDQVQYLVKWKNCSEEDNTWEIATNLVATDPDSQHLINSYEKGHSKEIGNDLNRIYENKAKRLKIDPSVVLDSPFNRDYQAQKILKGFNNNGEVSFLIKFRALKKPEIVPSCVAYVEIPQMVLHFYEKHCNFSSS